MVLSHGIAALSRGLVAPRFRLLINEGSGLGGHWFAREWWSPGSAVSARGADLTTCHKSNLLTMPFHLCPLTGDFMYCSKPFWCIVLVFNEYPFWIVCIFVYVSACLHFIDIQWLLLSSVKNYMPFLALMYFWGFRRHTPYGDSYYYFFNCMLSWAPHCCFTLFSKIVFNVCACACKCDCPNKYYYYYY